MHACSAGADCRLQTDVIPDPDKKSDKNLGKKSRPQAYFGAMQLVETDVVLAQPDWSGLMQAEAAGACGQWWIKGSAQLCSPFFGNDIDARLDYHINGNALYALGCPGFDEYIRRVRQLRHRFDQLSFLAHFSASSPARAARCALPSADA